MAVVEKDVNDVGIGTTWISSVGRSEIRKISIKSKKGAPWLWDMNQVDMKSSNFLRLLS